MKLSFIVLALIASFSTASYAYECNTVLGGCPTDTLQATSTNMRSDAGVKVDHAAKVAPNKAFAAPATNTPQNKLDSKKSNGQGVMQTLNKNTLK